ncbi:hypothetical protein KIPB_015152, partial [Kipferlia bialata]
FSDDVTGNSTRIVAKLQLLRMANPLPENATNQDAHDPLMVPQQELDQQLAAAQEFLTVIMVEIRSSARTLLKRIYFRRTADGLDPTTICALVGSRFPLDVGKGRYLLSKETRNCDDGTVIQRELIKIRLFPTKSLKSAPFLMETDASELTSRAKPDKVLTAPQPWKQGDAAYSNTYPWDSAHLHLLVYCAPQLKPVYKATAKRVSEAKAALHGS